MSRHQIRLLLCSAGSVALIIAALFAVEWFRLEIGPTQVAIGMRSAELCTLDEGCRTISLSRMSGFYPVVASAAFWCALALVLLVIVQCLAKVLTGTASVVASKVGYVLGTAAFMCTFAAGFLFGPETETMFSMIEIVVERTAAPSILLAGSLLATIALRYAQYDGHDDSSGEYKPIVLAKGDSGQRLPVTPLHVKPVRPPTAQEDNEPSKPPTMPDHRRLGTDSEPSKPPTVPDYRRASTDTEHTKTFHGERTKSPSQQPLEQRTKSASQQPFEQRTKSASQPPLDARTRSPSQPPVDARTKSASQPPVARTTSPAQPLEPRTKPPSDPPIDLPARARTSSSGPIDLAARLSGAPIDVAIKAPLPEPVPVPPDQIPVAPESGLVIRKRTQSAGPISADQIPVAPESGLVIRKKSPSSAPLEAAAPPLLYGKLQYAVAAASISSAGITAEREDGTTRVVDWDAIVGIIARRLPQEAPYEGATFVDLVSTAGATLRILPWTRVSGAPLYGEGEERARAFVQLVAARCLDAKLDSWTKVFSDGAGRAAQLPSAKTLDAHDARLA